MYVEAWMKIKNRVCYIVVMPKEEDKQQVKCVDCIHFYITWDKYYPKGCKAMGFKSAGMPSTLVHKTSGTKCLRFEMKQTRGKRR
ncbi:MAG: hypothetical protein A4E59_01064 [Syntrophorhabdus sp. PtaB.Bin027]|jgi:hypothetical protein|nr:MAG: hypothetical protein A4E59_01064 [Syntrophorhabdus sp. PtaB.Bin027]OQB77249.1 MAG: hypothetical protein BWX92_01061 [Deltaproteobacteria bacterium ADurb.Bin135]